MESHAGNSIFHSFHEKANDSSVSHVLIIAFLISILLGIFSGYFLAEMRRPQKTTASAITTSGGQQFQKGDIVGSKDASAFKDNAEGTIVEGGIDGEGQYHLVRPGGDSQNVYLTSSSVDLSQFVKRKVRVYGETQRGQKAAWLMDVGRVEILE